MAYRRRRSFRTFRRGSTGRFRRRYRTSFRGPRRIIRRSRRRYMPIGYRL